ncbi:MAG: uncharacterized protein JWO36_196 [Myxococcales bacterium]|nr:uncharacterized protein [Myxococcales bacterium]
MLAACGGTSTAPLPVWVKTLPDASVMGTWRGLVPARGIVHLHSPYSHDACDNKPRDASTGAPNEPCLADLRSALCADKIDYAALTDHDASMADEDFPTLFNMRGTDQAVLDGSGQQIASRMTCDDGHVVTFTVGGENDLMPIMLHRHVPGTVQQRHDTYNAVDAAAVTAFRDAGGLVWIAHTEQHPIEQLRALQPDGVELYNLHANIDPKIRGPYLGLDPGAAISAAVNFADTNPGHPEPDLALLSFLDVNHPSIDRWNQILGDGRHVAATAGSDAHENALPIMLADNERGDSYRRVMRWFANIVLVADPQDPAQIEAALAAGRLFAVFEMMGTPEGFDVHATRSTPTTASGTVELGGSLSVADGGTLSVTVPKIRGLDPSLPAPEIHGTILRIDASGPTVVATTTGASLSAPLNAPGAYRVEITIVPHHLGPYLGDLGPASADVERPWIYASPIYVQ